MSKRDLKKYLSELNKTQLEEQIMELYDKFKEVKVYYDFAFNPNENKLIREAKLKVTNEYYPIKGKKSKLRRSVAQKYIKHFMSLGMDAYLVSDFSAYINGEVITIDGGEWLQGAGQFNILEKIPAEMWDMLEAMIKSKGSK